LAGFPTVVAKLANQRPVCGPFTEGETTDTTNNADSSPPSSSGTVAVMSIPSPSAPKNQTDGADRELPGIHRPAVDEWLASNIEGVVGPFEYSKIAGGRSNLTYRVTDAKGRTIVLRRPPLGHVLATAHDMAREHRIISAVGKTDVPVARALGLCTEESVNGAPFYVMDFVDGVVLDSPEAGLQVAVANRRCAADSLIDVLVKLHSVDPDAIGLGDLSKRDGYIERQLRRWAKQWEQSKTRELPIMEELHARLSARMPAQVHSGIVHGDYRLGNAMVSTATGEITAVLDWELCTLGDVMADVGYLLVYWSDQGSPTMRANDPSGSEGFPSRKEMLARYADKSGRDISSVGYYEAFSCWRLACISEGVLARYKAGVMGDDVDTSSFEEGVLALSERAMTALESLG
jgi:aminoglycoside phosphotransferase (APT) family kinase protein